MTMVDIVRTFITFGFWLFIRRSSARWGLGWLALLYDISDNDPRLVSLCARRRDSPHRPFPVIDLRESIPPPHIFTHLFVPALRQHHYY
eukprot:scaffold30090_cov139-Skeletonema_dohrnii-CCMP3373.AAC.1